MPYASDSEYIRWARLVANKMFRDGENAERKAAAERMSEEGLLTDASFGNEEEPDDAIR